MEQDCRKALEQIEDKKFERRSLSNIELMSAEADRGCKYDAWLPEEGYQETIRYGIAFFKKQCRIAVEKKNFY